MNPKLELKMIGLSNLKESNFDLAADRLTEAFDEDPCIKYLLGSETYDYIKAKKLHKNALNIGLLYGSILTTSDLLEGISIWLPPSRVDVTVWMFIRAGGLSLIKTVRKDILKTINEYSNYALKIHHRNVTIPHWYLFSMGVGKEYQGKGFAGKMLNPVFNYFDQAGHPCYLETHNPQNIKFYEHYGFTLVEEGILPNSEKKHYAMLRIPRR
jgi:ribosomal protein S18 acetylase RimI-like enzyme